MKLSLNWIKEYVALPDNLDIAALCHDLTMRTVEVEGATKLADSLNKIVVGQITEIVPHPQADLLKVCTVDVGEAHPSTIVCGGSNIAVGMKVAVALPGAAVRWHGQGEPVVLKVTKLRGVESAGMICASAELELEDLFPASDEREIMNLIAFPDAPGTPLATALHLDDIILEIDNKSLTNRPDLWCHYGIARELAAIYGLPLAKLPVFVSPDGLSEVDVRIEDPARCRRYAALEYVGLRNAPSPYWMQTSLWKAGIRPISSLVDITNYVMLAIGQPTHAFDRQLVPGGIVVRKAKPGEQLTLLDGKVLKLAADDLMICDDNKPIALAGVMGGAEDSILPGTTSLLLEIANFEPTGVRRSATRYQVRSESAIRNEKGLDSQRVDQAMALAHQLIMQLYPEAQLKGFRDNHPAPTVPVQVRVNLGWLATRLGRAITAEEAANLLAPLGFALTPEGQDILVNVPTWRATGDVSLKDDVLEEVARMQGYEQVDYIPPTVQLSKAVNQPKVTLERRLREYLAFQGGVQEVFTYPWVDKAYLAAAGIAEEACLQLAAPPSPQEACLRPSLIPAMLKTTAQNLRYLEAFRVFELAQVFHPGADSQRPRQHRSLSAALVGKDARLLLRQAKGLLEQLPRAVMAEELSFNQVDKPAWADSKAWLNVKAGGQVIGSLGILSGQAAQAAGIKRAMVALLEVDVDRILPLPSRDNAYTPLPVFPIVWQDFSVLLDDDTRWADLAQALSKSVRSLEFVEEYHGRQVPEGKKSLTFRVSFGSEQGTLNADQIEEKVNAVKKRLQKLGGELRM